MGVYDILPKNSQVKCWSCTMRNVEVGHCVPTLARDYIVLLREGGYVKVIAGIVTEIVEDDVPRYPEQFDLPCFDKWGNRVNRLPDMIGQFQNVGGMDDPYYFRE